MAGKEQEMNGVYGYRKEREDGYDIFRISMVKDNIIVQAITHWESEHDHQAATICIPLKEFNNIIGKLRNEQ